jgi:hypothetical protein
MFYSRWSRSSARAVASRSVRTRDSGNGTLHIPQPRRDLWTAHLSGDRLETITNPTVLVEVLSPSTRDYDRGEKFALYRSIATFRDYLLIAQSTVSPTSLALGRRVVIRKQHLAGGFGPVGQHRGDYEAGGPVARVATLRQKPLRPCRTRPVFPTARGRYRAARRRHRV